MSNITCPTCGKKNVKNLRMHMKISHPESNEGVAPQPETEQPQSETLGLDPLKAFGFDPASVQAFLEPMIARSVGETLQAMQLDKLVQAEAARNITSIANEIKETIPKAVEAHVNALISQHQQGGGQEQVPTPGNGQPQVQQPSAVGDMVVSALIRKFLGGNDGGGMGNIDQLANMLKSVQTIAELANAPYRQGRHDALTETNETVKLMQGLGATQEQKTKILGEITNKELAQSQ
uniref:Uncharacterized protein n=1 Tax=viral metagenome TaxID=1070528 RepID=A0A6M3IQB7_9ZZZZ